MTQPAPSHPDPPLPSFCPDMVDHLLSIFAGPFATSQLNVETRSTGSLNLRKWPLLGSQYLYQYNFRQKRLPFLSKHFQDLTGHDHQNADLYFLYHIIHPEDLPTVLKATTLMASFAVKNAFLLKPLEHVFSIDYRIRKADGSYLRILRQTSILEKSPGQFILSLVSVCTDITHQKRSHDIQFSFNLPEFDQYILRQKEEEPLAHLGKREEEILKLLVSGKKNKEIATELNLSVFTVETHRKNLKKKLKLHNTAELAHYALQHGLDPTP